MGDRSDPGVSPARVSGISQIMPKRMVKSSRCAGHRPEPSSSSRVRTAVLNNDLAGCFCRWYPGFTHTGGPPRSRSTSPHSAPETTGALGQLISPGSERSPAPTTN